MTWGFGKGKNDLGLWKREKSKITNPAAKKSRADDSTSLRMCCVGPEGG